MLYPVFTAAFTLSAYYSVKKFDRSSAEIGALHFEMGRTIVSQSFNKLDQVLAYYRGKHAPQFIELIFNIIINFDDRPEHYIHPRAPLVTLKNTFILGSTILTDLVLSKVINDWENLCKAVNLYGIYYSHQIQDKLGTSSYSPKLPPLSMALESNDYALAQFLIEGGADVNTVNAFGVSPLIYATSRGLKDIVKLLVEHGADVNSPNLHGDTALHCAIRNGLTDIVKLLVEHGADVNAKNRDGNMPLIFAARDTLTDIVKLLVDSGADINAKNNNGYTPLFHAITNRQTNIVKLLVEHGADVNSPDIHGDTALHCAIRNGLQDIVKLLVEHGADIYAKDTNGNTPLDYSIKYYNHTKLTKLLLQDRTNLNLKPDMWSKLLLNSIMDKDAIFYKLAIKNGANVNAKPEDGISLLSLVIRMEETNKIDLVKYLLKHCANPNDADSLGQSLLHIAAARTNLEVIDLLFKYGANPYSKDHAGNIPAQYTSNQEVAEFIAQKTEEYDAHTALHQPFETCEPLSAV
jgi:ankyrin repeat protein